MIVITTESVLLELESLPLISTLCSATIIISSIAHQHRVAWDYTMWNTKLWPCWSEASWKPQSTQSIRTTFTMCICSNFMSWSWPALLLSSISTFRKVHLTSHLEVATMSNSDGYHCLIEDNITMHKPEDSIKQVLPSRTEIAWPANDLDNTWRLARLKGLAPEVTTFMWRLL